MGVVGVDERGEERGEERGDEGDEGGDGGHEPAGRIRPHQLRRVLVADPPAPWSRAGFTVVTDPDGTHHTDVGHVRIELLGDDPSRPATDRHPARTGIVALAVDGITGHLDGIPVTGAPSGAPPPAPGPDLPPAHPNGVVHLDHLVITSPDVDRTTRALTRAGLTVRRTRRLTHHTTTRRQSFLWMGDVIAELVGDDEAHGPGPATAWGLAFTVTDLDSTAARLGELLGTPRPAVQPGRRIATLRTHRLGISVPVALLSPHPRPHGPPTP